MFKKFFEKLKIHIHNSYKVTPYTIMSLGPNCYPRTVLARTHLIKRKKEGRKSYPFDLAWFHKARYITEFLGNDFENFLSELKYSDFSSSWDNGEKINFSHEAYIGRNEKNKLIRIYNKRIENFRNEMSKENPILFLQILKDEKVGENCLETYYILEKICGGRKFIYAVIDLIDILPDNYSGKIKILKLSLPNDNADVFSEDFYFSEDGKITENKIGEYLKSLIQSEWGIKTEIFL